jgi:hypothetical protein
VHNENLAKANFFSCHFAADIPTTEHEQGVADVLQVVKDIANLKQYSCVPFTMKEFSMALKALKTTAPGHDSIMNIFFTRLCCSASRSYLHF